MTAPVAPATLTTTTPGEARSIFHVAEGDYIWHRGAFRRVTAVEEGRGYPVLRMGRHVLRATVGTVEWKAAPVRAIRRTFEELVALRRG